MAMVQIENFCPFSDWLKNNLNFVYEPIRKLRF
jgi:hypothetical protein